MNYIDPSSKLLKYVHKIDNLTQIPYKPLPPINLEIDLSNRCNLGCENCHFAYTHTKGYFAPKRTADTGDLMPLHLAKLIMHQAFVYGVKSITWTGGGEPTLHPNIDEIIGECKLAQGIYTNGINLTPDRAKLFKQKMTWIYISMDYHNPELYAKYKRSDKYFTVYNNILNLVKESGKATIGIGFLLSKNNYQYIADMVSLGFTGVDYVQFRPMVIPGESDKSWIDAAMNDLNWEKKTHNSHFKIIADEQRFRIYQKWQNHGYDSCYWAGLQGVITPNGKMWVCVNRRGFTGDCLGDLSIDPLWSVWGKSYLKQVDSNCRIMCRGHIPNITVQGMISPPNGHECFI